MKKNKRILFGSLLMGAIFFSSAVLASPFIVACGSQVSPAQQIPPPINEGSKETTKLLDSTIDLKQSNKLASDIKPNDSTIISSLIRSNKIRPIASGETLTNDDLTFTIINDSINNATGELKVNVKIKNNKALKNGQIQDSLDLGELTVKGFKQVKPTNISSATTITLSGSKTEHEVKQVVLDKLNEVNLPMPASIDDLQISSTDNGYKVTFKPIKIYDEKGLEILNTKIFTYHIECNKNQNTYPTPTPPIDDDNSNDQVQPDENITYPSKYDSRDLGIIQAPENQGRDPICWSYSIVGASTASIIKEGLNNYNNTNLDFNEYQLDEVINIRDLSSDGKQDPFAIDELANSNYDSYSYSLKKANNLTKAVWELTKRNPLDHPDLHLNSFNIVNKFVGQDQNYDINAIKKEILKYGATTCSYNIGGQGHGDEYMYTTNKDSGSHAVTIIGWDDSIDPSKFWNRRGEKPTRPGGWLMKNSWGSAGDNGYFWLSYDSYINDIISLDYSSWANSPDSSNHLYYYDGSSVSSNRPGLFQNGATIFKAQNASANTDEELTQVNFAIGGGNNYTVKVEVYASVDTDLNPITINDDNPQSGKLVASKQAKFEYPGMKTITFDKPIKLTPNQAFSIVVSITNNGNGRSNPSIIFTSENNSYNDMSFVCENNQWINTLTDATSNSFGGLVARIRAITKTTKNTNVTDSKDLKNAILSLKEESYKTKNLTRYQDNQWQTATEPIVKLNNQILVKNQDYTVEYEKEKLTEPRLNGSDSIAIGYVPIKVIGKGIFSGSNEIFYPILIAPSPNIDIIFQNYGWIIKCDDKKRWNITIPSKITVGKKSWDEIKLPNQWEWAFKNYDLQKSSNYIKYNGNDVFAYRNDMFEVKLV